ncbi:MAG: sortase [Clostridiales bacterium]|nr:sortase [Clostridiales bacterium]
MKFKRAGKLLMVLGALFILGALALFTSNQLDDFNAKVAAAQVVESLDSDNTVINGNEYIGVLSIETLGLELPIMAECSYEKLETAPCCYSGSVESGDLVIAGHNYTSNFGEIYNLQPGDAVVFTDVYSNETVYEVAEIEYLEPTQVQEMVESDYPLTLYTCTYGAAKRVTVRCVLAGE